MASTPDQAIGNMEGAAALPRSNGELVFEAPWEGRAFGLAVALNEQGRYDWPHFRDRLVAEIAQADARAEPSDYYERWLAALESLLLKLGLVTPQEVAARHAEYASGLRSDDWDGD